MIFDASRRATSQVALAQDYSLYVAFTDFDSAPVTDMTPEDEFQKHFDRMPFVVTTKKIEQLLH